MRTRDGHINIGAPNQSNYERFCRALDRVNLIERDEFKDNASRLANREALEIELENTLAEKTSEQWLEVMDKAGVPAGPILTMSEVWADEQVQARDLDVPLEHPTAGTVRNIGLAAKLYGTPGRITEPAPVFAQHTREVLIEAGYTSDEISALVKSGAIAIGK